jgi:hypothetical protein
VIITYECRAVGEGAITTYFNVLGLTRPAQAGIGLATSWMLCESATTRLYAVTPSSFFKIAENVHVKSKYKSGIESMGTSPIPERFM